MLTFLPMFGVTARSRSTNLETKEVLGFRFQPKTLSLDSDGFLADNHIFSRFYELLEKQHPYLAAYISISKASSGDILVLTECPGSVLRQRLEDSQQFLVKWAYQTLCALEHLHQDGIICGNISIDSIYLGDDESIKLTNFGLNYMTDNGHLVDFPTVPMYYAAPELAAGIATTKVI
jgi:serine/threonine protein kinase